MFTSDYDVCGELPIGLALIQGYYLQLERADFGGTLLCDNLLLTDGPPILFDAIRALVESGNYMQELSDSGQPIINIDLRDLNLHQRQQLQQSGPNSPLSLLLLVVPPITSEPNACDSRFVILGIE